MGDRLKRLASKAGENLKMLRQLSVQVPVLLVTPLVSSLLRKRDLRKLLKSATLRKMVRRSLMMVMNMVSVDKVLADIRGRKDSDSDSGGGESSSGGGGEGGGKKKPGILKRIGKALKSGLKKALVELLVWFPLVAINLLTDWVKTLSKLIHSSSLVCLHGQRLRIS